MLVTDNRGCFSLLSRRVNYRFTGFEKNPGAMTVSVIMLEK